MKCKVIVPNHRIRFYY